MDSSPIGPLLRAAEDTAVSIGFDGIARFFIYFILLLAGGAYFAGAETSLASVNRIRMMTYADDGLNYVYQKAHRKLNKDIGKNV